MTTKDKILDAIMDAYEAAEEEEMQTLVDMLKRIQMLAGTWRAECADALRQRNHAA